MAVATALETSGRDIKQARVVLGSVAHKPWRSTPAEQALIGKPANDETFKAAMRDAKPLEHNAYKVELGKRAIALALQRAMNGGTA